MNREEILDQVFRSRDTDQLIWNILGNSNKILFQEGKSELLLVLAKLPEEKLLGLHRRDELRGYCIGTLMNFFRGSKSSFYIKQRQYGLNNVYNGKDYILDMVTDSSNILYPEETALKHAYMDSMDKQIESLQEFDRRILDLYIRFGSCREVARQLNVNYQIIVKVINRIRAILKEKIGADVATLETDDEQEPFKTAFTHVDDDFEQGYRFYVGAKDRSVERFDTENYSGPAVIEKRCVSCC